VRLLNKICALTRNLCSWTSPHQYWEPYQFVLFTSSWRTGIRRPAAQSSCNGNHIIYIYIYQLFRQLPHRHWTPDLLYIEPPAQQQKLHLATHSSVCAYSLMSSAYTSQGRTILGQAHIRKRSFFTPHLDFQLYVRACVSVPFPWLPVFVYSNSTWDILNIRCK